MKLLSRLLFCSLLFLSACGSSSRNKPYRIARDPTWYPLNLEGKEKNVLAFSDDLIGEASERIGLRIRLVETGYASIESGLRAGDFDAVMTTLEPDAFRKGRYLFSDPYFFVGEVLIVPVNATVKSLADLSNKRVGIQRGMLSFYKIEGDDNIIYKQFDSLTNAIEEMLRGELEGVVTNLVPAAAFHRGIYSGRVKIVGAPLTKLGIRLVVNRGKNVNEKLVHSFNDALREMLEDGTHRRLREKWGLWQQDEVRLRMMTKEEPGEQISK